MGLLKTGTGRILPLLIWCFECRDRRDLLYYKILLKQENLICNSIPDRPDLVLGVTVILYRSYWCRILGRSERESGQRYLLFAGRKLDETLTPAPALADGGVRSVWRPYRGHRERDRGRGLSWDLSQWVRGPGTRIIAHWHRALDQRIISDHYREIVINILLRPTTSVPRGWN